MEPHPHGRSPAAIRVLLGLQDTPGAAIKASEILGLTQMRIAAQPVIDIITEAGMLDEDREPSVTGWFHAKIKDLPEPMASELRIWLEVMRDGSNTPPRRLPRSPTTIRLHLRWALPALTAWAAAGHASLREISRDQVLTALPADGTPRAALGHGLRSIFTILKDRKIIFSNPIARVRTGRPEDRQPLPLDKAGEFAGLRQALGSADPARAAMAALAAFHGLRNHHLRALLLTDIDAARLRIGDRTILLAGPVRERLTTWLNHRAARWPATPQPPPVHQRLHRRANRPGQQRLRHRDRGDAGPPHPRRPHPGRGPRQQRRCPPPLRPVRTQHQGRRTLHRHPRPRRPRGRPRPIGAAQLRLR
jgi:hypothetical protein